MPFGIGLPELILIVVVLALLFGGKKIPELMRGLGSGIKEFKKAANVDEEEEKKNQSSTNTK
jgi:sec-independent protein translocase protein TatA